MRDPKHLCSPWEPKKVWMARTRPRLAEARGLLWREGSGYVTFQRRSLCRKKKSSPDTRKESCLWSGHIPPLYLLLGNASVGCSRATDMSVRMRPEPPGFTQPSREQNRRFLSAGFCKGLPLGGMSACVLWERGCEFTDFAIWVQVSLRGFSGPPDPVSGSEPSRPCCWPVASPAQTTVSVMLNCSQFVPR